MNIKWETIIAMMCIIVANTVQAHNIPEALKGSLSGKNYVITWDGENVAKVTISGESASGAKAQLTELPKEYDSFNKDSVFEFPFTEKQLSSMMNREMVTLDLPDGTRDFESANILPSSTKHSKTWVGKSDTYQAVITIGDNEIIGEIKSDDTVYRVETVAGKTFIVDQNKAGLEPMIVDEGGVIAEPETLAATPLGTAIDLVAPTKWKVGQVQSMTWSYTGAVKAKYIATVRYNKHGKNWVILRSARAGKFGINWKPLPNQATSRGRLQLCVSSEKKPIWKACDTTYIVVLPKGEIIQPPPVPTISPPPPPFLQPRIIDLLVYLNADVTPNQLNQIVAVANQAYIDSRVDMSLRLVGIMNVNLPSTTLLSVTLSNMRTETGVFSGLSAQRSAYGADIVLFVKKSSFLVEGVCGLAYINGSNGAALSPAFALSTVNYGVDASRGYFCYDSTLAHEIGHNEGAVHNLAYAPTPGIFPYAYGFCKPWVGSDIMSGAYCGAVGLNYFSSPNITVKGYDGSWVTLGSPSENVARTLNEVVDEVLNFSPATR